MSTTQEARRVIARSLLQLSLALGAALALAGPPFMTLTGPLPEDFVNEAVEKVCFCEILRCKPLFLLM